MSPGAGYSGTPLVRKLGIGAGDRVALVGAPTDFVGLLGELPPGLRLTQRLGKPSYDVIICFATRYTELERRLPRLRGALAEDGGLWLAWPKRASGVVTDLGDGPVRQLGLAAGLVDNKVCAIDATWSGLRFVYRVADRGRSGSRA